MIKMRGLEKILIAMLATVTLAPMGLAQQRSPSFDILGISIGMDSEAVVQKLAASKPSIEKMPCLAETVTTVMNASKKLSASCIKEVRGQIDNANAIKVELLEDVPSRPGKSVVHRIEMKYYYVKEAHAPKRPTMLDMKALLGAKYGHPDFESDSLLVWGSLPCNKRNCPIRGAYLDFRRGWEYSSRYDPDTLTLSNEEYTRERSLSYQSELEAARDAARLRVKPRF